MATSRNPLSNLTFGAAVSLNGNGRPVQASPASLLATPASHHELGVAGDAYVVTDGDGDAFAARLRRMASTRTDEAAHNTAWEAFWNRSWIRVTASPSPSSDAALAAAAANVTLLDRLNRLGFASMANSSAGHAIKCAAHRTFLSPTVPPMQH